MAWVYKANSHYFFITLIGVPDCPAPRAIRKVTIFRSPFFLAVLVVLMFFVAGAPLSIGFFRTNHSRHLLRTMAGNRATRAFVSFELQVAFFPPAAPDIVGKFTVQAVHKKGIATVVAAMNLHLVAGVRVLKSQIIEEPRFKAKLEPCVPLFDHAVLVTPGQYQRQAVLGVQVTLRRVCTARERGKHDNSAERGDNRFHILMESRAEEFEFSFTAQALSSQFAFIALRPRICKRTRVSPKGSAIHSRLDCIKP